MRQYAADLPRIEAYASELNQLWTNLIANAIEAMQGHGELRLRTLARDQSILIEITDSGPGIPRTCSPASSSPSSPPRARR